MNLKENARRLKADIPAVFLALKNEKTPLRAKLLAAVTVGYALSPVDLIPDFIPIFGYLDDLLLLPVLAAWTIRCIPEDIWKESRRQAEGLWENGKPVRWYYSIPILVFWGLVIWAAARALGF